MELDSSYLLDADGAADPGETDTQSLALLSSPFCVSWVLSMGLMAVGDEAGVDGGILLLIGVVTGRKQGSTVHRKHQFSAPATRV